MSMLDRIARNPILTLLILGGCGVMWVLALMLVAFIHPILAIPYIIVTAGAALMGFFGTAESPQEPTHISTDSPEYKEFQKFQEMKQATNNESDREG